MVIINNHELQFSRSSNVLHYTLLHYHYKDGCVHFNPGYTTSHKVTHLKVVHTGHNKDENMSPKINMLWKPNYHNLFFFF